MAIDAPGSRRTGSVVEPAKGSVWFPKHPKTKEPRRWPSGRVRYRGKVTWPDGHRQDVRVLEQHCADEEHAAEYIAHVQEQLTANGTIELARIAPPVDPKEMADWYDAWESSRIAKGLTATRDNRTHYTFHIQPALPKHVRDWNREDVRALVRSLDAKVQAGTIDWKYAKNVWGTATKMASDSVTSKLDTLVVRTEDPCAGVEGPDLGEARSKQYLWPSEFLRIVGCDDVPIAWRIAVAQAVFLYPRDGEHRVLRFSDVDLEHGVIAITRAWDRRAKAEKSTKTKRTRRFNVEPNLLPLLRALAPEDRTTVLAKLPSERDMARGLRRWLKRAGVDRVELHTTTATTKAMTWHDLRATGLTWMAVRGDDALKIMQRAGHERFETTQKYVREAEAIRDGFGDVFPPLPASLLDAVAGTNEEGTEAVAPSVPLAVDPECLRSVSTVLLTTRNVGGADGTRTRGLRRDRPAL